MSDWIDSISLQLYLGPSGSTPAPAEVVERLRGVEVTHNDDQRSGFQLNFHAGHSGPEAMTDYLILNRPELRPRQRVILIVSVGGREHLLMDGLITHQQLSVSSQPGASTFTVTGEDVSVAMDMEEKAVDHRQLNDEQIVRRILGGYSQFRLRPDIHMDPTEQPPQNERTPWQRGSDLAHLSQVAQRNGCVFYLIPGPSRGENIAYVGPPTRQGPPQRAISVNLGPESNTESVQFQHDALSPVQVKGEIQDRRTHETVRFQTTRCSLAPLSRGPAPEQFRQVLSSDGEGLSQIQVRKRAQKRTDDSVRRMVTASGELDVTRYGAVLRARQLVDLRGAGERFSGTYYVKSVTHSLQDGRYRQRYTLERDGLFGLANQVVP